MGSTEEIVTNKLLEIIADELYIARRDRDYQEIGQQDAWRHTERPALVKRIEELRSSLADKI